MPLLLRYVVGAKGIVMVERGRDMKECAERKNLQRGGGRDWESGSGREREKVVVRLGPALFRSFQLHLSLYLWFSQARTPRSIAQMGRYVVLYHIS